MVAQGGGKPTRQAIESGRAGHPAQNPAWADNGRNCDYRTEYEWPRRNAARDSDRPVQNHASGGKCGGRFRDQGALERSCSAILRCTSTCRTPIMAAA